MTKLHNLWSNYTICDQTTQFVTKLHNLWSNYAICDKLHNLWPNYTICDQTTQFVTKLHNLWPNYTKTAHYLYDPHIHRIKSLLIWKTDPPRNLATPVKKHHTTTLQPTTYHWIPRTRQSMQPIGPLLIISYILSDNLIYTFCWDARDLDIKVIKVSCTFYSFTLTFWCTTWWWPPQRPKHVVASYLHHIANKFK